MKKSLWVLALAGLSATAAVAAPHCSQQTTRGYWVYTCDGVLPPAPNAPLLDTRLLGTCNASQSGYWSCTGYANVGGVVLNQQLQGQAHNNADCTGQISYANTINGQLLPVPLDIQYVVSDQGSAINGLPTNSGGVLSCSLRRISISGDD